MDLRHLGCAVLAVAALVACNNGYSPPQNAYPGGAGGGNGSYGGGAGASGGGSNGGYGTGGGGSTGGGTTTGSGTGSSGGTTGATTSGTSGGSSGGSNTGSGVLFGTLAFNVASAGQFLPAASTDGGPATMEFELASFVLACNGAPDGGGVPGGSVLALNLFSGSPSTPLASGTYQFNSGGSGLASAAATLTQNDALGNPTIVATGQSGQMTWTSAFNGVATGTLSVNMSSGGGTSYLSGTFVAPFCGNF